MLTLEHTAPIYLNRAAADMRKSFDGLLGLVQQSGLADPLSGGWFVFRNRRGDRLKILYFDRDGLVIWYKRLERGRFQWPCIQESSATMEVPLSQLRLILEGIDFSSVRRRRRWSRSEIVSNPVDNCPKLDKRFPGAMVSSKQDDTADTNDSRRSPVDHPHAVCDDRSDVTGRRQAAGPGGVADTSDVRPQEREAAGSQAGAPV
ncbi:MAG: IS66 family insertion sequence element accessory protein TnpB [Verrucomicrobiota bacterium]|jgi:transposase|nr:IS66 family insertion sequence element accessory protein TnpB [Verrucomicrobiota bacterium]